jgi:hypothetical protein
MGHDLENVALFLVSSETRWALQIGSGLFWTLAYILIIKRGFQDRALGMPLVALCANISWEFIFSFIHPHSSPQYYVNLVWFLFDVLIFFQALKFGPSDFPRNLASKLFYPAFALALATSFGAVLFTSYEFRDYDGKYAAFGQNLMMSVLFVSMLLRRNSVKGQSIYIALFKMIGTLLPSILFYLLFPASPLLNFLYVTILVFDVIYLLLLYRKCQQEGINPWRRV